MSWIRHSHNHLVLFSSFRHRQSYTKELESVGLDELNMLEQRFIVSIQSTELVHEVTAEHGSFTAL